MQGDIKYRQQNSLKLLKKLLKYNILFQKIFSINFHKYKREKSEYQNSLKLLKKLLIYLVTYFAFIKFLVKFCEYKRTENQDNNYKNIEREYSGNLPNKRFLKVKKS